MMMMTAKKTSATSKSSLNLTDEDHSKPSFHPVGIVQADSKTSSSNAVDLAG
jgi:hypothetical protein